MDIEQKRGLASLILLGVIIVFFIIYFFWGALINRGTLVLIGDAPFEVDIYREKEFICETSPCEIKHRTGQKTLLLTKEGYESIVETGRIRLWRKTELSVDFILKPKIKEIKDFPDISELSKYSLVFDNETQMQKLVKIAPREATETAISYFQNRIQDHKIINGKNSILIIQENPLKIYRVNILTGQRNEIINEDIGNILEGKWSPDGGYLVFNKKNKENIFLLDDKNEIIELSISTDLDLLDWSRTNKLYFFEEGIFRIYNVQNNSYSNIGGFPEITSIPNKFIVSGNGDAIYIEVENKSFQVLLKE